VRELADAARIRSLLEALGREADSEGSAYLTGGATAVLVGWRPTTIDVDVMFEPESDQLLRAVAWLKNELRLNVELASPGDFIPLPSGWRDRSVFVARHGKLTFFHFDPYSQALAKLERAHTQDLEDVNAFVAGGLVDPALALRLFGEIEPQLYRFPAVDPATFRAEVERAFRPPKT
jgi:hypothetical protein